MLTRTFKSGFCVVPKRNPTMVRNMPLTCIVTKLGILLTRK